MPFSVFIPCKYLSADFVISNAKFFHFSRKATSGTENIRIPKFLLQTVVENIFKHGFSPEQFLSIFLESALEEQNGVRGLRMTVEDNGCGFPPEMLASFPVKEDNGHVGLSNLYHTLQLIYGPAASLHISNAEPNGARVTIFLPEEENHAHPSCG